MSPKMTDFSYVSCFVSCLDNTGYRIMCPPYTESCVPLYLPLTAKIKKKEIKIVGILAETLAEKYLEG